MNRKSYTLVEVLIAAAIFMFILSAVYLLFDRGRNLNEFLGVESDLLTSGRNAMHRLITDLAESSRDTLTTDVADQPPSFIDPLNGETHQILIFASARGNPAVAAEDDPAHAHNDYGHLDASHSPSWRSAVIYCTFVTPEGIQQLRRYIDYGPPGDLDYYNGANIFPFTVTNITGTQIILTEANTITTLTLQRSQGEVIANYIGNEDADNDGVLDLIEDDGNANLPSDNQDGVLDRGLDYNYNSGLLRIKMFLAKPERATAPNSRRLVTTLSGSVLMRN